MPERMFATRADATGRSFHTYRWRAANGVKTHIFRAFDDGVFNADWAQRPRSPLEASQVEFFPDPATDARWDASKRQQIAAELNHLNGFAKDAAGASQAMAYYRGLSPDALRVLCGLPGNDTAFVQLTTQPLDAGDPSNANRRGPDDADDFVIGDPNNPLASATLRAFTDSVDGRVLNRYFYRVAYVDAAHNRSDLSVASAPVYVPKTVAPAVPLVQLALADEGKVRLQWMPSTEPDLARYLLYRAGDVNEAADVRTMTLVARITPTPSATPGPGEERPIAVAGKPWLEYGDPAPPGREWFYRLVAVDSSGNHSEASAVLSGRAYKPPPDAPVLAPPAWDAGHTQVMLSWTAADPHLECQVERRKHGRQIWAAVTRWLARGVYSQVDQPPVPTGRFEYRVRGRDVAGQVSSPSQPQATL
jgi:hypothetical protein